MIVSRFLVSITFILMMFQMSVAQFELQVAFPNLSFTRPVDLQHAGDNSGRIFVVEQAGVISVFPNDSDVSTRSVFLNIQDSVNDSGNEMGLLGLAFHPDYKDNGYFYVNYTAVDPVRRSVISRFSVSESDSNIADPTSELELLSVTQPESNHNGGQVAFGPEGFLYIALGDGGGAGDDHGTIGNGQDRTTLLGKILRIDVDQTQGQLNYAIPADNPFAGNTAGYREEIFAWGLRNPWRFSFDSANGRLWAGDVGQNEFEEVDLIENGKNYGWRIMEGMHCYNPSTGCDTTGLTLPIWEYSHNVGQSITGGYVYHGPSIPELAGKYVYADYVQGTIWSITYDGQNPVQNALVTTSTLEIASFGVDDVNELYICAFNGSDSKIYRFKPTVSNIKSRSDLNPATFLLGMNYPNPFNNRTVIPYQVREQAFIEIRVYDVSGRLIDSLINREQSEGDYTITWRGTDHSGIPSPSGVYIVQLVSDRMVKATRKMILLQ